MNINEIFFVFSFNRTKRIFDWWSQTKARHEEDISVTLDLCHNEALDGNHYDEESHTCKFK